MPPPFAFGRSEGCPIIRMVDNPFWRQRRSRPALGSRSLTAASQSSAVGHSDRVRLLMASLVVLSLMPVASAAAANDYPSGRFGDDDRHPAEVAMSTLAEWGVVDGCNPPANSHSCPDAPVTRAEAAKIIVEAGEFTGDLLVADEVVADRFADDGEALGGGAERYLELLAAVDALHGCDPPTNRFVCPNRGITRGQAAKILIGAYGLEAPADHLAPWNDLDGQFYVEAARVASHHGLWAERSRFDGHQRLTRGELAMAVVAASGTTLCRPDPFTQAHMADLEERYPGKLITAHVYDTRTGCQYRLNHDNRQRTASVFKVMVMAGTLLEAQNESRTVSEWEMDQLRPMISESANGPVRSLWYSFGAAPWYRDQGRDFGLDDTTVRGDDGTAWGLTTTSAADQVDLLRQVLLGEWGPLSDESRAVALELMTDVVPSQTWGVTAGVPDDWRVAQKNGFAGITINSVGWVDQPGPSNGYLVAILSQGWPDHPSGIAAVERVNRWVAESMTN